MKMKGKMAVWAMLMLACTFSAFAGVKEVREQIEASMLVTGHVFLTPAGAVDRLEIDQPEKLPPAVSDLVRRAGATWMFEPVTVDGVARKAKARMSLRVVARKHSEDNYQITLRSAYFGEEALSAEERLEQKGAATIRGQKLRPPGYPPAAAQMGARGTVYLVVKVGRDGAVQDVIAEQVNLQTLGRETQMELMRQLLTQPALAAARRWSFQPPTEGPDADDPFWQVRVPVDYALAGDRNPGYGEWDAYIPGPRQALPWGDHDLSPSESPDAMIAGGVYQMGKGLRLLTPLGG